MDVAGSLGEEETVDALIAKLNQKGAKVKLLNEEDDESKKTTPIKTPKKHPKHDKENIRESVPSIDIEKFREMEDTHRQQ